MLESVAASGAAFGTGLCGVTSAQSVKGIEQFERTGLIDDASLVVRKIAEIERGFMRRLNILPAVALPAYRKEPQSRPKESQSLCRGTSPRRACTYVGN